MPYPVVDGSDTTCQRCAEPIVLVKQVRGGVYVLAADPRQHQWKCQPTAERPVQGHAPTRYANGDPAPPLNPPVTEGENTNA